MKGCRGPSPHDSMGWRMSNEQNLRPVRTEEEARALGRLGGVASGKARREKKLLRELAQMILDEEVTDTHGQTMTRGEAALRVQARKAIIDGDVKALQFLRDTAGQAPVQQVDVSGSLATEAKFTQLLEKYK